LEAETEDPFRRRRPRAIHTPPPPRYNLAPGVEIVGLDGARFQFRSDFVAMEMSGDAAAELVEHVLGDLDTPRSLDEIVARMPAYRPESVRRQLDSLVDDGVLVVHDPTDDRLRGANRPFRHLLDEIGFDANATTEQLGAQAVAIFGLEAHGAHVAGLLAGMGVGELVLVDPYPFDEAHRYLTPVSDPAAVGMARQDVVASSVPREGVRINVPTSRDPLDRAAVVDAVRNCDLAIVCWDRGMSAAGHWVNETSIASGTPALHSELRATSLFAGPFHFPGRSACLMCYRMRSLACETDFSSAMAYEEHLDQRRRPSLAQRPILPTLPSHLASILALEALRYLIRLNQPRLVDNVLEFDALQVETRVHPVLVEPACPACGKKKEHERIPDATSSA
jgi:ribosomal protein S12 methylthiotransferase accessory factor